MNFPRQCLHPAQAQFIFAAETKSTEFNAMMAIEEVFESPAVKSVEIEILDVMSEVIGKWRDPQCEIAVCFGLEKNEVFFVVKRVAKIQ